MPPLQEAEQVVQEAHRPQALGTGRKNRGCGHWWQDMGRGREGFRTIPNNVKHVLGFFFLGRLLGRLGVA